MDTFSRARRIWNSQRRSGESWQEKSCLAPSFPVTAALKGERNAGAHLREFRSCGFIVNGKSNKEIAAQLDLSVNTVAVHRANIMDTLGIHKTAEFVVYAIRNGLVNIS